MSDKSADEDYSDSFVNERRVFRGDLGIFLDDVATLQVMEGAVHSKGFVLSWYYYNYNYYC